MGGKSSTTRSSAASVETPEWTACVLGCGRLAVNDGRNRPVCGGCYSGRAASYQRPASSSYESSYSYTSSYTSSRCAQACGRAAVPGKEFCQECYEKYCDLLKSANQSSGRNAGSTSSSTHRQTATASSTRMSIRKELSKPQSTGGVGPRDPGAPNNVSTSSSTHRRTAAASASTTSSKNELSRPQLTGGARPKDPGSSNSSKKVEGIRDNLLCPIHLDLVERAKTLPCQHFMCEECLRKWVASRGDLRCPTCNTIHVLPNGGVSKLPDNFVINNLVAEIQKLDMEDGQGEELRTLSRGEQRATSVSSQRVPDVLHEYQERATSYSGQKVPAVTSGMQQGAAQTSLRSKMEGDVSFGMWQREVPISTNPHRTRGVPHAGASILTKLGNKMAVVRGYPIKLTLTLCDEEGEPMRGMQRETVEGTIHTPQGEQLPITDIEFKRRDGDYWIHFLPEEVGVHQIEVFLDGELVQGCPMKVVVRPNTSMLHLLVPGFMDNPVGVAATDAYVYIAETNDGLFRWMNMSGTTIGCPGLPGDAGDVSPFGIATMNDRLLITDCINSCVYVYDTGVYKQKFGTRVLESPTGIAVSKSGTIYVADMSTSSIDVFRPNFSHEGSINVRGKRGQSSFAMLALSQAEDRLIVADEMGEAIKIIDVQRRKIVKSINCRIQQAPARPFGVAVDEDDNIYISVTYDPARKKATDRATGGGRLVGCIIVYNSNGYFLGTIGENDLQNPRGVCVVDEPTPQLIVVDDRGITEGSCLKFFEV